MNTKKIVDDGKEVETIEKTKVDLEAIEPPMYRVVLINDDYTPMEFVVEVLMRFFLLSEPEATLIMLQVHKQGKGYCGVYTKDVAETKVKLVNNYSRASNYPLLCQMEKT